MSGRAAGYCAGPVLGYMNPAPGRAYRRRTEQARLGYVL